MLLMAALTLLAVAVLILTYGNRLATEGMGT
jgi:hypothetical protein